MSGLEKRKNYSILLHFLRIIQLCKHKFYSSSVSGNRAIIYLKEAVHFVFAERHHVRASTYLIFYLLFKLLSLKFIIQYLYCFFLYFTWFRSGAQFLNS